MATTFFGLTPEYKVELLKNIMIISHYSKGAFSVMDLYHMPVYMRNFFMKEFVKLKEMENKELEKAKK